MWKSALNEAEKAIRKRFEPLLLSRAVRGDAGEVLTRVANTIGHELRKYHPIHGLDETLAGAALAALPALSQQTQNSNHLDIKDRENENRAAQDVLAERQRQIEREGWTTDHDDEHDRGELAQAAACYASPKPIYLFNRDYEDGMTGHMLFEGAWPWDSAWWKPQHRRRDLVKAGALILAEIERLDRAALPTAPKQEE